MTNTSQKQTIAEKFGRKPPSPLQLEWRKHCRDRWGEKGPEPMQNIDTLMEQYQQNLNNHIKEINNKKAKAGEQPLNFLEAINELEKRSDYFDPHHFIANIAQNIKVYIEHGNIKKAKILINTAFLSPRTETTLQKVDPELTSIKMLEALEKWIEQEFSKDNIPQKFLNAELDLP